MWRPEMDLIDQLSGDAMPLSVVRRIFCDDEHARRVLEIYVDRGVVRFLRDGAPLAGWHARRLLREDEELLSRQDIFAELTKAGGQAFDSGRWDEIS